MAQNNRNKIFIEQRYISSMLFQGLKQEFNKDIFFELNFVSILNLYFTFIVRYQMLIEMLFVIDISINY